MACYPIILLIAGVNQLDTSNVFKQSIKKLVENCNENIDKSVTYLPTPLPDLYKPIQYFPTNLDKYSKYYDKKDDFAYIKHDDFKDKTMRPFSVNKDYLKKYIKKYVDTDISETGKLKNIEYEKDLDFTPLFLSENSLNKENFKSVGLKDPARDDIKEIKTNLEMKIQSDKPPNNKKHLRIGKPVPTIEDTNGLIRSFKEGSSFVVISDEYLKRLTNIDDNEQNPSSSPLYPGRSVVMRKYFGVSADYLAELIVQKVHKLKETGSKLFRQTVQEFWRVIKAALEYINTRKFEKDRSY